MTDQSPIIHITNVNVDETDLMVGIILKHTNAGSRVQFLVRAGRGADYIARIRVRISRLRVIIRSKHLNERRFILRAESYPYTDPTDGKRKDAVLIWQVQTSVHQMINALSRADL